MARKKNERFASGGWRWRCSRCGKVNGRASCGCRRRWWTRHVAAALVCGGCGKVHCDLAVKSCRSCGSQHVVLRPARVVKRKKKQKGSQS